MNRFIIIIVILFAASTGAHADYWDGWRAYHREDYVTALREWIPKAKKGDARAQYYLDVMYDEGQGLPVDKETAMEWFSKAARGGHAQAQVMLAIGYLEGSGVPRDEKKALKWYKLAATSWFYLAHRGVTEAQLAVAEVYASGHGVPRNLSEAGKWQAIAEGRDAEWKAGDWSPGEVFPFPLAGKDGVTNPLLTSKVEPNYPEQHRMAREQGKVVLLAVIRKDGTVGEVSISRSSKAHSDFERAAIEAVSQWRYEPAIKDGEPVEVLFTVWVSFTIH